MNHVCLVFLCSGEIDDYVDKAIAAFSTRGSADLFCKTLNARLRALGLHTSNEDDDLGCVQTHEIRMLEKEFQFEIAPSGARAVVIESVPFLG